MEVLSITNNKLRLHSSPLDLSVVCEYNHAQKDANYSDFTILPYSKSFLQLSNLKNESSLNLLRIKKKDDKDHFELISKVKGENISAISFCSSRKNKLGSNYSAGYTTGKIKTFDINSKIISEFAAPTSASRVIFLDYNSSDENLACVYENGKVNIYGLQTSVKTNSFDFDNQITLARFHPARRSQLAVASYRGLVTVMDIFAKKAIFKNPEAHSAPCSDVLMKDDLLFSSGYDTLIRLFDLRKKSFGMKIQGNYGWTTLAISKCGVYLIGGNMKGELVSYDVRNIKNPLTNIRIENSNQKISRVAFLMDDGEATSPSVDISKTVRQSCKFEEQEEFNENVETSESFIEEIVMLQKRRISDFSLNPFASNMNTNASRVSTSFRSSTESETKSVDVFGKSTNVLKEISTNSPAPLISLDDSCVNKGKRRQSSNDLKPRISFMSTVLHEINEEITIEKENDPKQLIGLGTPSSISLNAPRFSSTPTVSTPLSINDHDDDQDKEEIIELDDSFKSANFEENTQNAGKTIANTMVPNNFDFRKEFDGLAEKIRIEVQSMNMDENMRHIQLIYHGIEQRQKLQERIQLIEGSMALLMSDDYKISRIMELQAENDQLRRQLGEMVRRMST